MKLPKPDAFYDPAKGAFWMSCATSARESADYTITSRSTLKLYLRSLGFHNKEADGPLNPCEAELLRIEREEGVDYAGPLAGYPPGLHLVCGQRVLVTSGCATRIACEGKFDRLEAFLSGGLGDQLDYFLGWIKTADACLRNRVFRPLPLLALAGKRSCGKSRLQALITAMLGGRSALPYRYMSGQTPFNSELFGAEHLVIEDEAAGKDHVTRELFGSKIKNMLFNETQSHHPKGRPAQTLRCQWAMSLSLNDEPEQLMVLPPMDGPEDHLSDKIMLLEFTRPDCLPKEDGTEEGFTAWQKFWAGMLAEIPAFLWFLRRWRIPARLRDPRTGIRAWQNRELLASLGALSHQARLYDEIMAAGLGKEWEGTAGELLKRLREHHPNIEKWLTSARWCGVYLKRLEHQFPGFIKSRALQGETLWEITPNLQRGKS